MQAVNNVSYNLFGRFGHLALPETTDVMHVQEMCGMDVGWIQAFFVSLW